MGHGTVASSGLKKGVVVNIDQTVRSIAESVERAERLSGWKIDRAFVAVGGQHVQSLNSPGQVAVSGPRKEVSREDVNRAVEVARAVSIPSNEVVLHVERRGFKVDGQEGVKDPLGMSALRLEVEVHIVTGAATAVQNLSKCVNAAGVKIDELVASALASADAVLSRDREGARRRGRRHRRRHDRPRDVRRRLAVPDRGPADRREQRHQRRRPRPEDEPPGRRGAEDPARDLQPRRGRRRRGDHGHASSARTPAGRSSRREVCEIIEARMRETFELMRAEMARGGGGHAAGRDHPDRRRVAAGRHRRARPRGPRDAGPDRRADRASAASSTRSSTPGYSTAVGLLLWGASALDDDEPMRYESAPAAGGLGRIRDALRSIFP